MTDKEIVIAAAEVMGWKPEPFGGPFHGSQIYGGRLVVWNDAFHIEKHEGWNPLESISDAWMLVEALRRRGWSFMNVVGVPGEAPNTWGSVFARGTEGHSAEAPTAPRAITLAALKAIDGEGKA